MPILYDRGRAFVRDWRALRALEGGGFCEEPGVRYAPQRGPLFLWDMCRKAYRYAARTIWAVPAIRDRFCKPAQSGLEHDRCLGCLGSLDRPHSPTEPPPKTQTKAGRRKEQESAKAGNATSQRAEK